MESKIIYQLYRECVNNAQLIFAYYEKYNNCLEIDSLDKEMHEIFSKIGLTYAKFMMLVSKRFELDNPSALIMSVMSYAHNEKNVEQKSVCLDKIAVFMDTNENLITRVLTATIDLSHTEKDIDSIGETLTRANKIINRMELLLRKSQQIYQQTIKISA